MKNKIKLLLILIVALNSCQTIKDGLTGQKQNNSDEFLVTKKNRLEIPPDFDQLPVPKNDKENINQSEEIDKEVENLYKNSVDAIGKNGTVKIKLYENKKSVIIDFIDNGIGIKKSNFSKIFKPGYTTKKRANATASITIYSQKYFFV